jgi:hypothetical protein
LLLLVVAFLPARASVQAACEQSYNGHIQLHNEVVYHTIALYQGSGHLRAWTDSYSNGANFDPIITLWHNGVRIAMNDDNQAFTFYQSYRDAGVDLTGLADGTYVVTITAYPNFPLSTRIDDGFTYDNQTPIPIDTWCQPGNPGPGCHSDRHFSLHWTVQ